VLLIAAGALFPGVRLDARSKKADMTSRWRSDTPVVVDGVNEEWGGMLSPVKDAPVSVAFSNDEHYLYFCLTTSDRSAREQILRQGLIVWIDPDGGKKKTFGVEFPVGMPGTYLIDRTGDTGEARGGQRPVPANQDRLVILGPGKNDRRDLAFDEAPGIQAKIGETTGVLVYEMRVPLSRANNEPFAAGANDTSIVGVGLETPQFDREGMRPTMRGGSGGIGGRGGYGGRGGMGGRGGYGGRGGMGPGGRGFEATKPVKVWKTVQLSAPTR
jgi:hypothetical protein